MNEKDKSNGLRPFSLQALDLLADYDPEALRAQLRHLSGIASAAIANSVSLSALMPARTLLDYQEAIESLTAAVRREMASYAELDLETIQVFDTIG
jgi:hypothetical protein